MIYSEKYNFIFLHNPRTAGTSIQSVLKQLDSGCMHSTDQEQDIEHAGCRWAKELFGDHIWNNSFKFCFVRNPYSWFLSSFQRDLSWYQPKIEYSILVTENKQIAVPIDGIVKKTHVILIESMRQFYWQQWNKGFDNGFERDDAFFDSFINQSNWATDEMDFIGRFESLQSDFNYVCDEIGLERTILPHLNEDERDQRSMIDLKYSESAKKMVGILYEEDIVKFGYER